MCYRDSPISDHIYDFYVRSKSYQFNRVVGVFGPARDMFKIIDTNFKRSDSIRDAIDNFMLNNRIGY